MKQSKSTKIICFIIIALTIIAGIAMIALKGFNVEVRYTAHQKVELVIGEEIKDVSKIQEKADEVFGKGKSVVQIVEVYKDTVQITAKEITEEQKNSLVEKVNELYPQEVAENAEGTEEGTETEETAKILDASTITIQNSQNARLRDFLKPYVIPVTVVTTIIIAYFVILYYKLGIRKIIIKSVLTIVLSQAVLLSVLALTRFPMGRFSTPLILLVYVTSLINLSGSLIKAKKAYRVENVNN